MLSIPEYTKRDFDLSVFVSHVRAYRRGKRADTPRCIATCHLAVPPVPLEEITFTFSDYLLDQFLRNKYTNVSLQKDLNSALTYGFRGFSNGQINGILRLRDTDYGMQNRVDQYIRSRPRELINRLGTSDPDKLEGVKIVVHRPNGIRTIGVRNNTTNYTLFFDRLEY